MLAGGRSTRMGRDKALLAWPDPEAPRLIATAVALLRSAGCEPHIAGQRPDLASYAPVVPDLRPGLGPLGGIECALASCAPDEFAVFVPVDVPMLPPELLRALIARAQITGSAATLPSAAGQPQPLCVVLAAHFLPVIRAALDAGEGKVLRVLARAGVDLLRTEAWLAAQRQPPAGTPAQWFRNLNSAADL